MIKGVIPVLQTPFHDDGSLDLESLGREVRFVCGAGVPALAFPGFASEWWKLSEEEIFRCAEVIADCRSESVLFIANITAQSTNVAVQQATRFRELGAGALMCLPPFVFPVNEDAALIHLQAILEAAPVPMILQHAATLTKAQFQPKRLLALHDAYPNFCCIKVDSNPAAIAIGELARAFAAQSVSLLVGYAGLDLPDSLACGAHGMMPGSGHLWDDMQVFCELQREPLDGLKAFRQLLPLLTFEMQNVEFSIAVHKKLLHQQGVIRFDHIRTPGCRMDRQQEIQLMALIKRARP